MSGRRTFLAHCAGGIAAAGLAPAAQVFAQPAPPGRIIVANPPGGQTDAFARVVAQGIQRRTGQVLTIDNRPGAGGLIGVNALLGAPADGHTLLLTTLATMIAPSLHKQNTEALSQLEPVCLLASGGSLVLIGDRLPAADLASFIALARQQPGKLTYSSGGSGSSSHLLTEYMKSQLGIDLVHVPYKGGAPAALAIRTGEVDLTILDEANAAPLLKDGKVRAIAQTGLAPLASFPGLPRLAEVAPGFDASFWMGITVRKGTPMRTVERLNQVVNEVVGADLQESIKRAGLSSGGGSRASFAGFMAKESSKWLRFIKASAITTH